MNLAVSFLSPSRLWLLLAVVALAAVYVVVQVVRRPAYAVRFTNLALLDVVAPKRPGWRRHLAAGAFLLGVAALVLSLAKPAHPVEVPRERATVVLAIDVSLSMAAEDVEPNRLSAAKDAAELFLDTVPPTINVGLVRFAGTAGVVVPPTTDHERVRRAVEGLDLGEGTGIGEAIFASLDALETLPDPADEDEAVPATIIVLSDGETTQGRPDREGVEAAIAADVPVSTIAFGTADGFIVIEGELIPVPPLFDNMADIAEDTGGIAFQAEDEAELAAAYEDLGSSIGFEVEDQEISAWFVGAGLVALLAAAAVSLLWFSRLP